MVNMTYRAFDRLATCLNLIHCRLDSADLEQFLEMMDTIVTDACLSLFDEYVCLVMVIMLTNALDLARLLDLFQGFPTFQT